MTDTTTTKTRTITLTDRPPVTIREDQWPVQASAKWYEGEHESQANRRASVRVREHDDGRRIVYGMSDSQWRTERVRHAGVLIPAPATETRYPIGTIGEGTIMGDTLATIAAIHQVAEAIGYPDLAQECIADLPAEEL